MLRLNASNGQIAWERLIGGPGGERDRGWDILVGPDGHPVAHGFFGRTDGTADHVTIKLHSADGDEIWRQVHPGAEGNLSAGSGWLAACDNGDIVMAGRTWSMASSYDVVLHRYAALDGAPVWMEQYDAGAAEDARQMVLDSAGDILVAGVRSSDFMVLKFDASDGGLIWASGYNGPPGWYDAATCVTEGPGSVVIAGGFSTGAVTSWDAVAVGFDPEDGSVLWDVRYDYEGESDEVRAVAVTPMGDVYLVGYGYGFVSDSDMLCLRYYIELPATVGGAVPLIAWGGIVPNPVSATAEVRFDLPQAARMRVDLFDATGRWVLSLEDREFAAGPHRLAWDGKGHDGRQVPAGAYWVCVAGRAGSASHRLVVIR